MPDKVTVKLLDNGVWVITETCWDEDGVECSISYLEQQEVPCAE